MVSTFSFASDFGLSLQHLENMEQNPLARELGFNEQAMLRLIQIQARQTSTDNLELNADWASGFEDITPVESRYSILKGSDRALLQESFDNHATYTGSVDNQTRTRLNSLATLLRQRKDDQVFRIPKCLGWRVAAGTRTSFVFEYPGSLNSLPMSLHHILSSRAIEIDKGSQYSLAYSLACSMAQLHMVQWVHQSFRSENVLFCVSQVSRGLPQESNVGNMIPYSQPWILGFDYSRSETYFSRGFEDTDIRREVYRHPDRQRQPEQRFTKLHDIYSLGVVLLEIGLWELAIRQEHPDNPFSLMTDRRGITKHLEKVAYLRLPKRMGRKYTDVVLKCLTGDFGVNDNTKEDIKLQQAFRAQVIDVLQVAKDSI
ncbi:hypothetical protein G7054_g3859 [Neopestalotiopsis clavispora]|nr:hypothetical protein G7054_g3859 [Neopestalotiopsis clavispora]